MSDLRVLYQGQAPGFDNILLSCKILLLGEAEGALEDSVLFLQLLMSPKLVQNKSIF